MTTRFDRRQFLASLAAATVAGSRLLAAAEQTSAPATSASTQTLTVPRRRYGRTGVDVSILSLGGMFDIPNNQLMLKKALDWGVTYWDTADCYGNGQSELGIGMFFEKMPEARKQVFLVTKSDRRDPAGITELLNRSLERMKTDWIDLYFIHGVSSPTEITDETKAWAEKAKAEKKIRYFGFSTHKNMEELLEYAAKLGWIDGIMVKYDYRLMQTDRMRKAIDACVKAGIGITAMKTQGGGPVRTDTEEEIKIAGHFLAKGYTPGQAKLKAVWQDERVSAICSQMPNITILKENVLAAADDKKLTAEDWRVLQHHALATASSYCRGCAHLCESAQGCEGVPIADVMRFMMYKTSYGDVALASEQFRALPEEVRQRLARGTFATAEKVCPQGLAISSIVREAVQTFA
ncbi:MAG: aldo/keto reductase [Candidatus Sumerlaeaceae bacterium]